MSISPKKIKLLKKWFYVLNNKNTWCKESPKVKFSKICILAIFALPKVIGQFSSVHSPTQFLGWDFLTANRLLYKIKVLEFSILYDFQILNVLFVIKFSNCSQLSWRNTHTEKYWKYQYLEIKIRIIIISIIGDVVKLWDILYLDLVFLQLVTQRVTSTINVMVSFNSGQNYVE